MWFSVVCTLTVLATICIITVVKIFLTHKMQQGESTTNFDHCTDATFQFVFILQYQRNVKENVVFRSECELKMVLGDTLT